jgi:hypothetical protein
MKICLSCSTEWNGKPCCPDPDYHDVDDKIAEIIKMYFELLNTEIKLKRNLQTAIESLKFYANKENHKYIGDGQTFITVDNGSNAQQTLKEIGAEE